MMNPNGGRERGIDVAEEVLEEGFEIENLAVEDAEVLELAEAMVDGSLSFLLGGLLFFLDFGQEPMEVIDGHDVILRVLIEQGLDLRRCFRYGELEPSLEAETHSIGGLFGHGDRLVRDRNPEAEDLDRKSVV